MRRPDFTFLELLIAVSLFTVGMVSVLQIFPVNRRLLTQSTQTTQASFLAQEQIEKVRNVAYADLTTGSYEPRAAVSADSTSPLAQYERETEVSLLDTNTAVTATDVGLKKIVVTVYWTERNISRQYSLSTYTYDE